MSKISVIIAHEYLTRIRAKWFLISTLLAPFGLALLVAVPVLAAILAGDGSEGKVAVLDKTGQFAAHIVAADTAKFVLAPSADEKELSEMVTSEKLQAYVVVPKDVLDSGKVRIYSRGGTGIAFEGAIQSDIEPLVVKGRLLRAGTDTTVIDLVERGIEVVSLKVTEEGVKADASKASAMVGYMAGFMIYMLIFLYGSMVMRGVVEEKANRIIEVVASSVRPFEIMMGKVIGIGLVGLTQIVLWVALGALVTSAVGALLGPQLMSDAAAQGTAMGSPVGGAGTADALAAAGIVLPEISIVSILMFVFNFFAGYFLYASLFAAVGSAVDQEADANSLTFPITFPVILTMLFIGNVIAAPNGTLAVVLSLIPLFSPILMTVRVAATDVPAWQLLCSIGLSVAGFFGAIWLASRIYRIGILSYGKKPTLKEIARWVTLRV